MFLAKKPYRARVNEEMRNAGRAIHLEGSERKTDKGRNSNLVDRYRCDSPDILGLSLFSLNLVFRTANAHVCIIVEHFFPIDQLRI